MWRAPREDQIAAGQVSLYDVGDQAGIASREIADGFDGSISWYTVSVKLDLEARGEIERVPGKSPQLLRLTEKKQVGMRNPR